MADALRAQMTLQLHDELSAGLQKIIAMTKQFRDLAKSLGFGKLDSADAMLSRVGKDIQGINAGLGATARQAEAATVAIRRMSEAELAQARAQGQQAQRAMAMQRQINGGAGLGQIYGPGGMPLVSGGSRFGPGASGPSSVVPSLGPPAPRTPVPSIPPPPMPWAPPQRAGGFSLASAWGGARSRVGGFASNVGLAGSAMAGISLMAPIREAAEFDNVLTHIAITAGATAGEVRGKVAQMSETYRAMALATKQSSHDVAESAQFLITTGIGEEMTNRLLPIIAQAATAYNTPMRDAVQGAFSMHEELGIKPEDMKGALSAAALAAKQGHFSFSDISQFLPGIAAQAATTGIKGRDGLNALLAALETSRRGAGTSGQAATNLQDFLSYINAPIGAHSFKKAGVDLPKLLQSAEKGGINPMEAVVEQVRRMTTGMTDAQKANLIGKLFHNQEARVFVQTMLRELEYYNATKKKIAEAGTNTIDEDFQKAQNLHTRLAALGETSAQLTQKIGLGFSWVVPVATGLLGGVLVGLGWMDHHLPGVADGAIGVAGGMLGLVSVMGVLGTVAGPVKAGFLLMGGAIRGIGRALLWLGRFAIANPLVLIAVAGAAAALYITRHWEQFGSRFSALWTGIKQMFHGDLFGGAKQAMNAMWGKGGIAEQLFGAFGGWVDSWTGGLATKLGEGIQAAMAGVSSIIQQSIAGWEKLFSDFKPEMPQMGGMAPPPGMTPETWPKFGEPPPALKSPSGGSQAPGSAQRDPAAATSGKQHVHVTFSADVPGRTTVRHEDGSRPARGPMLARP